MVHLKLFGGASLEGEDEVLTGAPAQRHRVALLALLVTSPSRGLSRDKLMGFLWPGRDTDHARKLLNQSVYVLRRALGDDAILSVADDLRVQTGTLTCDVVAFGDALAADDDERAVQIYSGPFLDGFFLDRSIVFERWVEEQRARLAEEYTAALERLAEAAEHEGRLRDALAWWKARAAQDPYDSAIALHVMRALAASGNPAGAIQYAADHQRLLEREMGIEAPAEVAAFVGRLRDTSSDLTAEPAVGPAGSEPPDGTTERDADAHPAAPDPRAAPSTTGRVRAGRKVLAGPAWLRPAGAALLLLTIAVVIGRFAREPTDPSTETSDRALSVDSVADAVVREVERRLTGDHPGRAPEQRTRSIRAYELYQQGTDPTLLRSAAGARRAFESLREAVAVDPTYAAAWAALACTALRVGTDERIEGSRKELHAIAENAALEALALDDSLAEGHAALGLVRMASFEFQAAEEHLERAIELDRELTPAREWLVSVYLWTGRPERALAAAEAARELNPVSPTANAEVARALAVQGRCDESLSLAGDLLRLQPPLLRAAPIAARCHIRNEDWEEAISVLRPQVERSDGLYSTALFGYVLAQAGRLEAALRIRAELRARQERHGAGSLPVAIVDAGLEDPDAVFDGLHRAIDDGSLTGLPLHSYVVDVILEPYRGDPRAEELLGRIGLRAQ